ncbi:MAG: asparaginase [Gulosibacter sp.]|uniref:asparaginase n=1 Tax=Gulosibacter sp. TaxID=2817531 RepID=UPI003F905CE7
MSTKLPRISMIALGGTIASVGNDDGEDAVPSLTATDLLSSIPAVESVATIVEATTFRQYPSGDLTVQDLVELASLIESQASTVDGFVITQGTDTLEETSFVLDLLLRTDTPVVLTGAMRNAGLPGADGPANMLSAIRVAASEEARSIGPLVVFADEIHLPRFVQKVHSSRIAAFESPNAGPIGMVTEDRVWIGLVPKKRTVPIDRRRLSTPLARVGIFKFSLGSDLGGLRTTIPREYDGLVIEAFGGGHVPAQEMAAISEIAGKIPVVMTSRSRGGETYEATYAFPGSERDLLENGVIGSRMLDGLKARLLLLLLISSGASDEEIRSRFAEPM